MRTDIVISLRSPKSGNSNVDMDAVDAGASMILRWRPIDDILWTTIHIHHEQEIPKLVCRLLEIPYISPTPTGIVDFGDT